MAGRASQARSREGLLSEFNKEDSESGKDSGGGALANKELEKQFEALVKINDQLSDLKKRGAAADTGASCFPHRGRE